MSNKVKKTNCKTNNKKKRPNIFLIMAAVVLSLIVIVLAGYGILRASGKASLYADADPLQQYADGLFDASIDIEYNGKIYRYNKDIITFLVMGIDSLDKVPAVDENTNYHMGGQSDALFLAVMNPHNKSLSVIAINRNSMADIYMCDKEGNYTKTAKAQICVQHGYGDGRELSCERTREAVSGLMYGLPINGYVSMRMGAVMDINNAAGGVEVVVPSDFPELGFKEGETVRLDAEQAYFFVRYRDTTIFDSAGKRLENDKVYLKAFLNQAYDLTKKDIAYPIKLYNIIADYVMTDITIDEMTYLASELLDYSVSDLQIYSMEGQTVRGEKYEEFYVDEAAAKKLILDIYYEEVK